MSALERMAIQQEAALAQRVLQLRQWQQILNEELKSGAFAVPVHLAMGYEALAVAVDEAMGPGDQMVLTHRNITYHLARGGSIEPVLAEYRGSEQGLAAGRLGSMNLTQPARGIVYTSSILGNNLPVACGLALAHQTYNRSDVVWVVLGDGSMEEGAFYESLLFAASHQLAVVFLIENNDHSLASTIAQRRCRIDGASLCGAAGVPFASLSGNDVALYRERLRQVRRRCQSGGPACVEVALTMFNQHAGPTPGWPSDPKRISIEDGLLLEPHSRDPVYLALACLEQAGEKILA